MLSYLAPYYENDAPSLALIDAVGRELQRIEDTIDKMRDGIFPQLADDTYRLLGMHEHLLGLTVEPAGETMEARRNKVVAARKRSVTAASDWALALETALGTTFTHVEHPGERVILNVAGLGTTITAAAAIRLARPITPAHMDILTSTGSGFIIGVSLLGEEAL